MEASGRQSVFRGTEEFEIDNLRYIEVTVDGIRKTREIGMPSAGKPRKELDGIIADTMKKREIKSITGGLRYEQ